VIRPVEVTRKCDGNDEKSQVEEGKGCNVAVVAIRLLHLIYSPG
jgi:hypothetical protein